MVTIKLSKGGSEDSVTVEKVQIVESTKVGSVTGVATDKKGKEIAKVKLRDAIFTPTFKFNLLSITKL